MCSTHKYFLIITILITVSDVFCIGCRITTPGSEASLIKSKLSIGTKSCRIPSAPNTIYFEKKSESEKENLQPNSVVDGNGAVVHIDCGDGARESTSWQGEHYMICYDGQWYPPNNVCIKLCPDLSNLYLNSEFKCTLNGEPVSCEENIGPRTVATRKCKSGYVDESNPPPNICEDNGEWNFDYVDCFNDCGEIDHDYHSNDTEHDNLVASPWKAGLYKMNNDSEHFEFICGATLVAPATVVTAARCVKDSNGSLINSELLRVGLGKSYMLWNDTRDIHAQKFEVAFVTNEGLHAILAGDKISELEKSLKFLEPLSFVFLKGRITFNSFVRPICSDTQGFNSEIEYLNATLCGWDRNTNHALYNSIFYKNEECKARIFKLKKHDAELEKEIRKFGRFCTDRGFPDTLYGSSVIYHNGTADVYYLIGILIGIHESVSIFHGMRDREAALSMLAYYNNLISRVKN